MPRSQPVVRTCRERGQATYEYIGVVLLVAAIIAVLVGASIGPKIASGIERAICLITNESGASCRQLAYTDRARKQKCLTGRQTREFGYNITAFSVRADRSLNDRLSVYGGNGPATVTLYEGGGIGAEGMVGTKTLTKGIGASGHVSLIGEYGFRYKFDNEEKARDFLDDRRGGIERYVDLAIPGSTALETGWDFLRHEVGPMLGCDSCASEERVPDKIVAKVGVQAEGSAFAGASRASGSAKVGLAETGTIVYDPDTGERTFEIDIKGEGTIAAGVSGSRLPVELQGLLNGTARGSMAVKFGPDGQPKTLTLTTKHGYAYGGKAAVNGGDRAPGLRDLSVQKGEGRLVVNKAQLDLTRPENRAVFDKLFQPVGGTVVVPKLQSPGDFVDNLRQLGRRYAEDGLFVRSTYDRDLSGGDGAGDVPVRRAGGRSLKGGEGLTFGVGGKDNTTVLELRKASVRDMRRPGSGWMPLPTCNLAGS